MLKKSERLTTAEFEAFFKVGKRFHFTHLTIIYKVTSSLSVGVVVGKKVAKLAVRRNAIRRRIYASLYKICKEKELTGTYIVLVKPTYNSLTRVAADEFLTASIAEVIKST